MPKPSMPTPHDSLVPWPWPGVVLCAWVAGTAVQLRQAELWGVGAYAGMAVTGLCLVVLQGYGGRRWHTGMGAARWLQAFVLGLAVANLAFAVTGLRSEWFARRALAPTLEGQDVRVVGVVRDLPQAGASGWRFRFAVESAVLSGQPGSSHAVPVQLPPLLELSWYGHVAGAAPAQRRTDVDSRWRGPSTDSVLPAIRPGERWSLTVRLKAPHGAVNPHGFDYALWLWEQGVQALGYVRNGARDDPPLKLGASWQAPVAQARYVVRERIERQLQGSPVAGTVVALVVGDQSAIAPADWQIFRDTGVAHLVSISGLHITMFAWAASALLGRWWRCSARLCLAVPAPVAALLGGAVLASAYALFSGWGLPAQRTCLMLVVVALLRSGGVRWPWHQVWLLAGAVVVACDPWALLQAGFWLSFVAVAALFLTEAPHGVAQHPASGHAVARLWRSLLGLLREQWLLTLALTPLTALWFGQVSVVGLVANLVAIPWATLVVTPLAMVGVLVPQAWELAASAVLPGMAALRALAAWPGATLAFAALPLWLLAVAALGSALLVLPLPRSLRWLGVAMLVPVVLWQPPRPAHGAFDILAADVGQGNAVLLRTATHSLVYDAGPRYGSDSDAGQRVLVPLLRDLQLAPDLLVLSHRDTDHVGGAQAVLQAYPGAALLASIEAEHPLQAVRPAQRCVAGQRWQWDGVLMEVLHPEQADYARKLSPNALSCVLRIQAQSGASVLLAGDVERAQEQRLAAQPQQIRADVLLVPHHGSNTSSSEIFLDAVQPRHALVQAGYRNTYGHPRANVLQRYQDRNIVVHQSPHCGAMHWRSVLPDTVICYRQQQRRYWHHRVP